MGADGMMARLKNILNKYGLTKTKAMLKEELEAPVARLAAGAVTTTKLADTVVTSSRLAPEVSGHAGPSGIMGATGAYGPPMAPSGTSLTAREAMICSTRTVDSRVVCVGVPAESKMIDAATDGPPKGDEEFEVICLGVPVGSSFDVGERYMAKSFGPYMTKIQVFDPYGKWIVCDTDCFEQPPYGESRG